MGQRTGGDPPLMTGSDIHGTNGLADATGRVSGLPSVYVHEFERDDIVRSGLVRHLMDRYET